MEIDFLGQTRIVPVMCTCRQQEYKKRQEEFGVDQKRHRLERLRQYSLMDDHFAECEFKNFEIDDKNKNHYKMAKNYCKRWNEMKAKNMGFMFYGPPGVGKSYLAFCIANELLGQGVPVVVISSIGMLNRIKEIYNSYGKEGEVEVINNLKNASLLVLDDLGAENSTPWAKEKIYEIIDNRYRDGKPMIVTTNLTREQLQNKLTGDDGVNRTYDRLVEMCYPIKITGKSRRAKTAASKTDTIKSLLE